MGKRKLQAAAVLTAVALSLVLGTPGASAACHSFSTQVTPASAQEGGKVTVVVSRDNGRADSNVRVSTVDGTAKGASDFAPLNQQVNFTGSETQRSFEIQILDDQGSEGPETFLIRLSEPGGCSVNPNFVLAPDRTVTIAASDGGAGGTTASTTAPAATTTSAPASTTSTAPSDEPAETETGGDSGDDGGLPVVPILILIFLLLVAGGVVVTRRNKG